MVRVEILSIQHSESLAAIEASPEGYRVEGPRSDLIDTSVQLLGLPSGRSVSAEDAPEEWARGLIIRYRSPDLSARIVYDDDPLPTAEEPVRFAEMALH